MKKSKNILFLIGHPAHVHLFRNTIRRLNESGFNILVLARDKEITLQLLDNYDISYKRISKKKDNLAGLFLEFIKLQFLLLFYIAKYRIDLCVSSGGAVLALPSKILFRDHFVFTDTEHAKASVSMSRLFATRVFTPDCFFKDLGKKQIRYSGFHELAYLHPEKFTPDPGILEEIGVKQGEEFFILRFVSWKASHDLGQSGFTEEGKRELVNLLKSKGKIIISSESELPTEFEEYRMQLSTDKIHDLLYYSSMYVGEGGTMASEAALLGTPAVFVSTLNMGYIEALDKQYGLLTRITNGEDLIGIVKKILNSSQDGIESKRQKMLKDKISVSEFLFESIILHFENVTIKE